MRIRVECCHHCVAPKRCWNCHATCEDYERERKQFEADKQAARENMRQTPNITSASFNDLMLVGCKNLKPRKKR